jgi:hypothetical protein
VNNSPALLFLKPPEEKQIQEAFNAKPTKDNAAARR